MIKNKKFIYLFIILIAVISCNEDNPDKGEEGMYNDTIYHYKHKLEVYTTSQSVIDYLEKGYFRLPLHLETDIGAVRLTAYDFDREPPLESAVTGWLSLVMPEKTVYRVGASLNMVREPLRTVDSLRFQRIDTIPGISEIVGLTRVHYDTIYFQGIYERYIGYRVNSSSTTLQNLSHTQWYNELPLEEKVWIANIED